MSIANHVDDSAMDALKRAMETHADLRVREALMSLDSALVERAVRAKTRQARTAYERARDALRDEYRRHT